MAVLSVFAAGLAASPVASAVTFSPAPGSPFAVGSSPFSVAVGDFNGDGKLDLAVANFNGGTGGTVSVLLGNGSGGFSAAPGSPFAVGNGPASVAVGDFNGDGKLDLAVANVNGGTVSVLLGNGSGGFSPANGSPFAVGRNTFPFSVAVGDFNGDGCPDLAVANSSPGTVSVLLNKCDGSGGFSAASGSPFAVGSSPFSVAVGDFNGDGKLDLVTANQSDGTVSVLLGDGSGSFSAAPGSPFAVGQEPTSVAVGDFNGDGCPDLATANQQDDTVSVLLNKCDGSGGFSAASGSPYTVGDIPLSVAVGDFNGDGKLDLAVANGSGSVSVRLGNGSGGFTTASGSPFAVGLPHSVAVGDFNGDGHPDLAATASGSTRTAPGSVWVLLNSPPNTTITSGPASTTRATSASFTFSSDDRPSTFRCRLDDSSWAACTSPVSYSGLAEGSHTFRVRATNDAGLTDPVAASQTWTVDLSSPPVAALSASPNVVLTGDQVTFDASASHDSLDGTIVDYEWDLGSGSFDHDTGSTPAITRTYDTAGMVHARVKVTNEVGGTAIASVDVRVFAAPPPPPPGPVGVSINNGAYATNSTSVQLYVVWPKGEYDALISNDGGFGPAGGTQSVPLAPTIPWTLFSAASERLPKIVYLRFGSGGGFGTETFTDDIILDTTTPVVQSATSAGTGAASDVAASVARARPKTFRVRLRATEHLSGISVVQFSTSRSKGTTVRLSKRTRQGIRKLDQVVQVRMRARPRYVRVRSAAGNWSKWHRIT